MSPLRHDRLYPTCRVAFFARFASGLETLSNCGISERIPKHWFPHSTPNGLRFISQSARRHLSVSIPPLNNDCATRFAAESTERMTRQLPLRPIFKQERKREHPGSRIQLTPHRFLARPIPQTEMTNRGRLWPPSPRAPRNDRPRQSAIETPMTLRDTPKRRRSHLS